MFRRARRWCSSIFDQPSDYNRLYSLDSRLRTCSYRLTFTVQVFALRACHEIVIISINSINDAILSLFFKTVVFAVVLFSRLAASYPRTKRLQEHREKVSPCPVFVISRLTRCTKNNPTTRLKSVRNNKKYPWVPSLLMCKWRVMICWKIQNLMHHICLRAIVFIRIEFFSFERE